MGKLIPSRKEKSLRFHYARRRSKTSSSKRETGCGTMQQKDHLNQMMSTITSVSRHNMGSHALNAWQFLNRNFHNSFSKSVSAQIGLNVKTKFKD
jgi:hypothetical protein